MFCKDNFNVGFRITSLGSTSFCIAKLTLFPNSGAVIDPSYTIVDSGTASKINKDCAKKDLPAPYGPTNIDAFIYIF